MSQHRSRSPLLLRLMPYTMIVLGVVMAASLNVRIWPLEFVVSYIPNLLIMSWVYLMLYATIATWHLFIYGRESFVEKVGKVSIGLLLASGLIGVYVLSHSINIVQGLDISERLTFKSDRLTVGTFNKLYRSQNFAKDADAITASKVDVFSLQEVHEDDINFLKDKVNHDFSYITECDCSANDTEVGIISRYPIINALTVYEHENSVIARAQISSEEHGEFVVYAVHMHVPYGHDSYNLRDDAMKILSDAIDEETLPTFAIGDFNTTVFSPDMQNFMRDTSRVQNVVTRSWPRCSWFGTRVDELACVRIDYVFAPVGATAYSLEVGDEDSSDHRSVTVEVSL